MQKCMNEAWSLKKIIIWILIITLIGDSTIFAMIYFPILHFTQLTEQDCLILGQLSAAFLVYCALAVFFHSKKKRKFDGKFNIRFKAVSLFFILGAILNVLFLRLQLDLLKLANPTPAPILQTHWPIIFGIELIIIGVVAPFIEELIYRGILLQTLTKHISVFPAIVINVGIFALGHLSEILSFIHLLGIVVLGSLACLILYKTNALVNTIALHSAWNITGIFQIYALYDLY